ncbi:hypothetical protein WMY93_011503 [Mugilogobius chulae]|uniref:Uncharacterized protein n=1 Tax=Mugilogobius chulae TaxID=88201 RepID=A0AAW0PBM0_9GOBI
MRDATATSARNQPPFDLHHLTLQRLTTCTTCSSSDRLYDNFQEPSQTPDSGTAIKTIYDTAAFPTGECVEFDYRQVYNTPTDAVYFTVNHPASEQATTSDGNPAEGSALGHCGLDTTNSFSITITEVSPETRARTGVLHEDTTSIALTRVFLTVRSVSSGSGAVAVSGCTGGWVEFTWTFNGNQENHRTVTTPNQTITSTKRNQWENVTSRHSLYYDTTQTQSKSLKMMLRDIQQDDFGDYRLGSHGDADFDLNKTEKERREREGGERERRGRERERGGRRERGREGGKEVKREREEGEKERQREGGGEGEKRGREGGRERGKERERRGREREKREGRERRGREKRKREREEKQERERVRRERREVREKEKREREKRGKDSDCRTEKQTTQLTNVCDAKEVLCKQSGQQNYTCDPPQM